MVGEVEGTCKALPKDAKVLQASSQKFEKSQEDIREDEKTAGAEEADRSEAGKTGRSLHGWTNSGKPHNRGDCTSAEQIQREGVDEEDRVKSSGDTSTGPIQSKDAGSQKDASYLPENHAKQLGHVKTVRLHPNFTLL